MAKVSVSKWHDLLFVVIVSILCLQLCASLQEDTSIYTVQVFRRISFDIYVLSLDLNSNKNCDSVNRNYLVNEVECVSDQELFSGMTILTKGARCSVILPSTQSIVPIADINNQGSSVIYLGTDFGSISSFIFNDTKQLVNGSFCNISRLEVYRGREQTIEINHEGFSLNDNGSVEVDDKHRCYDYLVIFILSDI